MRFNIQGRKVLVHNSVSRFYVKKPEKFCLHTDSKNMVDVPNKTDIKDRLWRVYFDNIYFASTVPIIMRILKNIPNEQVLKSGFKKKKKAPEVFY